MSSVKSAFIYLWVSAISQHQRDARAFQQDWNKRGWCHSDVQQRRCGGWNFTSYAAEAPLPAKWTQSAPDGGTPKRSVTWRCSMMRVSHFDPSWRSADLAPLFSDLCHHPDLIKSDSREGFKAVNLIFPSLKRIEYRIFFFCRE